MDLEVNWVSLTVFRLFCKESEKLVAGPVEAAESIAGAGIFDWLAIMRI
jgi:hypothetical protein